MSDLLVAVYIAMELNQALQRRVQIIESEKTNIKESIRQEPRYEKDFVKTKKSKTGLFVCWTTWIKRAMWVTTEKIKTKIVELSSMFSLWYKGDGLKEC